MWRLCSASVSQGALEDNLVTCSSFSSSWTEARYYGRLRFAEQSESSGSVPRDTWAFSKPPVHFSALFLQRALGAPRCLKLHEKTDDAFRRESTFLRTSTFSITRAIVYSKSDVFGGTWCALRKQRPRSSLRSTHDYFEQISNTKNKIHRAAQ